MFKDFALLKSFVTIVESGSISAAAVKLQVTQSWLSRQLKSLEDQCDAVLLRRDTHRMSLTETGHRFLVDARAILDMAEEAEQRLRNDQTAIQGNLRIFSTIDWGQSVVSRLIASFIQAHPAVTFDLAYSNRPLHMIEEGCDAGVIAGSLTDDSVVARSVGHIERHLVASPSLVTGRPVPRDPEDLRDWPWLSLNNAQFGGTKLIELHSNRDERRLDIEPVMTSEGVTSLREAARMGLGISIMPDWLVEDDLTDGRLVRVLPEWHASALPAHVVYPLQRRLPLRVRTFVDFATEYMTGFLAEKRAARVPERRAPASRGARDHRAER